MAPFTTSRLVQEEAILKKHSTIGEGINVAKGMNSKICILTHFSQRYAKLPELNLEEGGIVVVSGGGGENGEEETTTVIDPNDLGCIEHLIAAWDFMRLNRGNLERAARLSGILKTLFAEVVEEVTAEEGSDSGSKNKKQKQKQKQKSKQKKTAKEILSEPGAFALLAKEGC